MKKISIGIGVFSIMILSLIGNNLNYSKYNFETENSENEVQNSLTLKDQYLNQFQPIEDDSNQNIFLKGLKKKLSEFIRRNPSERIYLHTDKSFYYPGESIWFCAYLRNETDLKRSILSEIIHVELLNPQGNSEAHLKLIARTGIAIGDFYLDNSLVGGRYKIKAYTNWQKNVEDAAIFEKEIQIQKVIVPNVLMKLDFKEKGYGPGDEAKAHLELRNLQDRVLKHFNYKYQVILSGITIIEETGMTDSLGKSVLTFSLPTELESNDGLLNVIINYKDNIESISRSIPIQLNNLQFELYPEGGDLVYGIQSKVGFQALNEFGKPIDCEGVVFDKSGSEITKFKSFHHGMGAFSFKPVDKGNYFVRITKPEGISKIYDIPEALNKGFVLNVAEAGKDRLMLNVQANLEEEVSIVVQVRGKVYYSSKLQTVIGSKKMTIPLIDFPIGVAQITLFDKKNIERAERLVFVNKHKQLNIMVSTDKDEYLPREKVKMTISAKDERDMPIPAQLSLSVVDDKIVSFADDKSGNILSKLLLEADITGDVEEPGFYFDPKEKKANKALDYLLMTRGWRRFTWKEVLKNKEINMKAEPDKAIISGILINPYSDRPIPRANVKLFGSRICTKTDKYGRFSIDNLDLTQIETLEFQYYKDRAIYPINKYGKDLLFYLPRIGESIGIGYYDVNYLSTQTQGQFYEVKGKVCDVNGQPLGWANISAKMNGINRGGAASDENGEFTIRPLIYGIYDFTVQYVGYKSLTIKNVLIDQRFIPFLNIRLQPAGYTINTIEIVSHVKPLLNAGSSSQSIYSSRSKPGYSGYTYRKQPSRPKSSVETKQANLSSQTFIKTEIMKAPTRNVSTLIGLTPGLSGGSFKGQRNSETIYFIDGVTVRGFAGISPNSMQEINFITSGIPAEYGYINSSLVNINDNFPPLSNIYMGGGSSYPSYSNSRKRSNDNYKDWAQSNLPVVYYRAKEFPKVVYKSPENVHQRNDYRSTIYWKGNIELDNKGKITVEFYNSDAVTTFRATVEGISEDGMVGRTEKTYHTLLPVTISLKVPPIILTDDIISVPISFENHTNEDIIGKLEYEFPNGLKIIESLPSQIEIPAMGHLIFNLRFKAQKQMAIDTIQLFFKGNKYSESITHCIEVFPLGFPVERSFSGTEVEKEWEVNINKPIDGTIKGFFIAYPSTITDLLSGIESLLREPHGCFEQASSTTYPNILVMNYLLENNIDNVKSYMQAYNLIANGYQRLARYETNTGGFDWYGKSPGNVALTAFGLMEFVDMKKVYEPVDQKLIERTKKWLLDHKDGKGRFSNTKGKYGYGLANNDVTNAYVIWALTEAGVRNIYKELEFAYNSSKRNKDLYQLGILANTYYKLNNKAKAEELLASIIEEQEANGSWCGNLHSITRSTGRSLRIETTAIIVLAILESENPDRIALKKAIDFLMSSRSSYGKFGSTQGTILSLKAITEYSIFSKRTREDGIIKIYVDNEHVKTTKYSCDQIDLIEMKDIEKYLHPGINKIRIKYCDVKYPLPYSLGINWNTSKPISDSNCAVTLNTSLSTDEIRLGETARLKIQLENTTNDGLPTTIAIIGIPAGLSLQSWQLKELDEKEIFDFYEIIGNNIVLYFRQMLPEEMKIINLDLKSEISGTYEGDASSAYLYYTDEMKNWAKGNKITIKSD